jgi:hypothetical protein
MFLNVKKNLPRCPARAGQIKNIQHVSSHHLAILIAPMIGSTSLCIRRFISPTHGNNAIGSAGLLFSRFMLSRPLDSDGASNRPRRGRPPRRSPHTKRKLKPATAGRCKPVLPDTASLDL